MQDFLKSFGITSGLALGLIVVFFIVIMLCMVMLCFICITPNAIFNALTTPIPPSP